MFKSSFFLRSSSCKTEFLLYYYSAATITTLLKEDPLENLATSPWPKKNTASEVLDALRLCVPHAQAERARARRAQWVERAAVRNNDARWAGGDADWTAQCTQTNSAKSKKRAETVKMAVTTTTFIPFSTPCFHHTRPPISTNLAHWAVLSSSFRHSRTARLVGFCPHAVSSSQDQGT
ncbi:hypothetical protein OSB04_029001 [Centaurea solstitialis]|uniref:Uncharacterized protein n=1 Tax=Centaurea solstitialis TaxID=347529 RepID=A0AA38W8A5_9ASTR|nr:hypothetical protein OSB04_029001 [Centaurea solstitialis]